MINKCPKCSSSFTEKTKFCKIIYKVRYFYLLSCYICGKYCTNEW